jgi:hypothetical protein
MAWVEVPVPEELEAAVKAYLMQLSFQAALVQWDMESMGEHLRSLEEEPRRLLGAVAAGVVSGELVEDAEVAEQLGVSVREVYGIVREANGGNKGDLVYARAEPVPDGSGGVRNRQLLYMLEGYAVLVQQNEALGLDRPSA